MTKKIKYSDYPVKKWFGLLVKAYRISPLAIGGEWKMGCSRKSPHPVVDAGDYHVMISISNDYHNNLIISVGKWCSETSNPFVGIMAFVGEYVVGEDAKLLTCNALGGTKIENHIHDIERWINDTVFIDAAVGELGVENGVREPIAYYIPELKKSHSRVHRKVSGFSVQKRYAALAEIGNLGVVMPADEEVS
jgi:hypothetical protein